MYGAGFGTYLEIDAVATTVAPNKELGPRFGRISEDEQDPEKKSRENLQEPPAEGDC